MERDSRAESDKLALCLLPRLQKSLFNRSTGPGNFEPFFYPPPAALPTAAPERLHTARKKEEFYATGRKNLKRALGAIFANANEHEKS